MAIDYEGDENILSCAVVEDSQVLVGNLVTAREIAHSSKSLSRLIPTWSIRESVTESWLSNPRPLQGPEEPNQDYRRLLDLRADLRLRAHVRALQRLVSGVDKLGEPATYSTRDQIKAAELTLQLKALYVDLDEHDTHA